MSCLLYYGPGAEEEATQRAEAEGRLLAPPFGVEGLKVDDARQIVELMGAPPVGTSIGVVLAGPMDKATPEASDALLKSLEEFDPSQVQPILWAQDAGAVIPTIRSRCLMVWCPHGPVPEMEHLDIAEALVNASLMRDYPTLIGTLNDYEGKYRPLLGSVVMVVSERLKDAEGKKAERLLMLWDSIREVVRRGRGDPSVRETLAALLLPYPPKRRS